MNKLITSFLFITVFLLSACSDDEPQDSVKEIRMLVSAETGVMYAKENPIECMLVKTEGDSEEWQPLGFNSIEGFTYIKGHEYYLSVKRTILANPPADGSDRTYSLIRILQDRLVTEPEIPVDEEITSEEDIEYQDLCPFEKYAISKGYIVDENGKIVYDDGYDSMLPSYSSARIWLEDVLDKEDPNWVKFESVPYMAIWYATNHTVRCSKMLYPKMSLPTLHNPCSPAKKFVTHSSLLMFIKKDFKRWNLP